MHSRLPLGLWMYTLLLLPSYYLPAYGLPPNQKDGDWERALDDYGTEDTTSEEDYFHFVTRPDIRALKWNITVHDDEALAPGYWFVAPYALLRQRQRGEAWIGPYIYDDNGGLIWSGAQMFDNFNIFDFRPIQLNGQHMFTAIYKREDAGVIVDNNYQIQKMIRWPGGHDAANMHEFTLFEDGRKALMLTLEDRHESSEYLRELGHNEDCYVKADGLVELDITTSPPTKLFSWSLLDHISLEETTFPSHLNASKECHEGWDAHHCNAIDRFANGDYLVSCRHTDAVYKVSRETGDIVWRLGGTKSDFEFANGAKFSRQHHSRLLEANDTHTILSLFDNARSEGVNTATHDYTRGLILSLHHGRADLLLEIPHPEREWSTSRGSLEILPNGNILVGWTFHSRISEHTPDGTLLMYAKLPPKKNTYRAYKSSWIGRPAAPPDLWAHAVGDKTDVYVSWNGATDVAKWNIYKSNSQGHKGVLVESGAKSGFETFLKLDGWVRYIIAEAVDTEGNILGHSRAIKTVPPDRNVAQFVEEQSWLNKHLPSNGDAADVITDKHNTPWDRFTHSQSVILAYTGGILTCLVVVLIWWVTVCLKGGVRSKPDLRGYTRVHKDDFEDYFELEEDSSPAPHDLTGQLAALTSKHQ